MDILKKLGAAAILGTIVMGLVAFVPPLFKYSSFIYEQGQANARAEQRIQAVELKADRNEVGIQDVSSKIDILIKLNCETAIDRGSTADIIKRYCL